MELEELNSLSDLNELDLLYKIIDMANSYKNDAERVLKGEKAASTRLRFGVQDIKWICEIIRDKAQIRKGITWESRQSSALERLTKKAREAREKEAKYIERKKNERLAKLQK